MKLSKKHREDFVEAVMSDVPSANYPTQAEDRARLLYKQIAEEAGVSNIPLERLEMRGCDIYLSKHGQCHKFARNGREAGWAWKDNNGYCFFRIGLHGLTDKEIKDFIVEDPEIQKLVDLFIEEKNKHADLRQKVTAVIAACSTLKQAKEALPEFEKYLPAEPGNVDRSLPVAGNLVADLTKAGWPAKKKIGTKK